jgi:hypothetical protein
VPGAPSEAIKPPHQDHIKPSLLGIVHQLIQCWSTVLGSTNAFINIFLVDVPASFLGVASEVQ